MSAHPAMLPHRSLLTRNRATCLLHLQFRRQQHPPQGPPRPSGLPFRSPPSALPIKGLPLALPFNTLQRGPPRRGLAIGTPPLARPCRHQRLAAAAAVPLAALPFTPLLALLGIRALVPLCPGGRLLGHQFHLLGLLQHLVDKRPLQMVLLERQLLGVSISSFFELTNQLSGATSSHVTTYGRACMRYLLAVALLLPHASVSILCHVENKPIVTYAGQVACQKCNLSSI